MSEFIIDKQIGENGHTEYGWSSNIQEKILQLSFQLTRTDENNINNLKNILFDILFFLKQKTNNTNTSDKELAKGLLSILYKMIGHTRDIVNGKGEYELTYMMILTWYSFYPELSKFAIKFLVDLDDKNIHPYGSWKDIKYFCHYCRNHGVDISHPLIEFSVNLMNNQILKDENNYYTHKYDDISLASKWVPREKSPRFGYLYQLFATNYYKKYIETVKNKDSYIKAISKCKMEYRKTISMLNNAIETLEIKQCAHMWANINFNKVTSISLSKQKKAFLNIKTNGDIRYPEDKDRVICSKKFNLHVKMASKGIFKLKGKRLGMADFTKTALKLLNTPKTNIDENDINYICELDLLNLQWANNSEQNETLGKMIAMVDVSGSMNGDPMNAAIALGIRIAEKSILGKRVLTFSNYPTWVNLEHCNDFVSQVDVIRQADWGTNTDFYAALSMILDSIIENKMAPEDVQDMSLVVLSDMQIDKADDCNITTMYESIKQKYEDAGIRVNGKPYKPPHIIFWNLRSTSGFPNLYNQTNTSMISGYSPALLNSFCENGLNSLQHFTPWSMLEGSLSNKRYQIMSDKLNEIVE